MDDLRIGLLGCGRIARYFHLRILDSLPGASLVAIADPDEDALAAARAVAPRTSTHADWRAVIGDASIDAVVVCLPSHLHETAGVDALRAGKHVYLEKPVALDAAGAGALLDAESAQTGAVAMAGFNFRHHPLFRAARRVLDGGTVGAVVGVRTTFAATPRRLPAWKRRRETGGGALLDLASHHADLVRYLLGEAESVSAGVRSLRHEADTATVTIHLRDGLAVQSLFTLSGVQQDRIEIHGDAGELILDRYRSTRPVFVPAVDGDGRRARVAAGVRRLRMGASDVRGTVAPPRDTSFAAALGAFVDAARSGRPADPTLTDGARSLAIVLAAERSAATGRPEPVVDVADRRPGP